MKSLKIFTVLIISISSFSLSAYQVSLEECIELSLEQSGLLNRESLLTSIEGKIAENNALRNYPEFGINGQVHHQSDVFAFPGEFPLPAPDIPKTQGRLSLNLTQPIYTGGRSDIQYEVESIQNQLSIASLKSEKQALSEQVASVYFSILSIDKANAIFDETLNQLKRQRKVVLSSVENGLSDKNSLEKFDIQIIEFEQKYISNLANKKVLMDMLQDMTGIDLDSSSLELPEAMIQSEAIYTPKFEILDLNSELLSVQSSMEDSKRMPWFGFFAQAGIGTPNPYNFFETDLSFFYIGGLRLNWILFDYGRAKRNKSMYSLRTENLIQQKEYIAQNLNRQLVKLMTEIKNNEDLKSLDLESVALQQKIVDRSLTQLNNGMITSNDYLSELDKLTRLKLAAQVREINTSRLRFQTFLLTKNDFNN